MGRVIRLVADPYPPYQFEEGGRIRGIDQETIQEAFRLQGIEALTVLMPWKECLLWMDQKKADGIFQIVPSEERRKLFHFSEKLRAERTTLFARSAHGMRVPEGADIKDQLAGRTLGVLDGYSYGPAVDGLPGKLTRENQEALLLALTSGEADLVLMDAGVASYLTPKMGIQGIVQVPGYAIERPLHVAFQAHHRRLAKLFNAGLREVKARAIDRRIFEAYGVGFLEGGNHAS